MNKQRGIIIGVLALAVTMMVGYALFSDTITINGTATANGEFDIGIECQGGIDTSIMSENEVINLGATFTAEEGYKNDSCSVTGNVMSFSSELGYPGATRYFTAKITNNGTIDAIIDMNSNEDVGISQKVYLDVNDNGSFEENEIFDLSKSYGGFTDEILSEINATELVVYGFEKADGIKYNTFEEPSKEFFSKDGSSVILNPGESGYILFKNQLNKDLSSDAKGQTKIYTKTESSYTLTFHQPRTNQ